MANRNALIPGTPVFDAFAAQGEKTTNGSANAFPDKPGGIIRIKARAANAGKVYIGTLSTTSAADNTSDNTTGLELSPGEADWFFISRLSNMYIIGANGDGVTYVVYGEGE